jgi:predicted 2-oxoglutarate/Fe(II)-dependent dioxygenase YbiX
MKKVWDAIQQYYLDVRFSWFTSWAGYSNIRYNKYPVGSQMNIHCDHIHTLFPGERKGVPILSIVGCLNEEFLGGRFIMFDNEEIYLNVGDILIFPSNFLYPHKVTEVTDGTRYSFVSWTW